VLMRRMEEMHLCDDDVLWICSRRSSLEISNARERGKIGGPVGGKRGVCAIAAAAPDDYINTTPTTARTVHLSTTAHAQTKISDVSVVAKSPRLISTSTLASVLGRWYKATRRTWEKGIRVRPSMPWLRLRS